MKKVSFTGLNRIAYPAMFLLLSAKIELQIGEILNWNYLKALPEFLCKSEKEKERKNISIGDVEWDRCRLNIFSGVVE